MQSQASARVSQRSAANRKAAKVTEEVSHKESNAGNAGGSRVTTKSKAAKSQPSQPKEMKLTEMEKLLFLSPADENGIDASIDKPDDAPESGGSQSPQE